LFLLIGELFTTFHRLPAAKEIIGDHGLKFTKKFVCLSVCAIFAATVFSSTAMSQSRDRVVKTISSQPTNLPPVTPRAQEKAPSLSRPVLENKIVVVSSQPAAQPLIKKTGSSMPTNAPAAAGRTAYGASTSVKLDQAIKSRYGIHYRYGSTGPNAYDCSGFVWSAFQEAGINFTRASARSLWERSEPVAGDDRFKFGTLVFLNGLGHMGIVADANGFYHASSSKGITYSPFKGYWEGRIVGFRKLTPETPVADK
jgi:cell wall-associated NlpC family hydrolase